GGPPLVQVVTGEVVSAEELGGGDVHARSSGVADHLASDDAHALRIVRSIVSTLGPRSETPWQVRPSEEPALDQTQLYGVVPDELRTPYDVRDVIGRIEDGSRFAEIKKEYVATVVTGFADVDGHTVDIDANQRILVPESA